MRLLIFIDLRHLMGTCFPVLPHNSTPLKQRLLQAGQDHDFTQ